MPSDLRDLPLILVSGQARSGTTILTRAIGAHPQILSNNRENVWLRDLMEVVVQTVNDPTRVRELSVSADEFLQQFRESALRMLFPSSLAGDLDSIQALSTFTSLRQETFDALEVFLPNFRIANIVRNGIEVVGSRLKHSHIGNIGDFETHCVAWAHSTDVIDWFGRHRDLKDRFFLVRHEWLLDPQRCQEVFGRIENRFGLQRTESCSRFVLENFVSRNQNDDQSPQTSEGAASREQVWQTWDAEMRGTFERVCGGSMEQLGYEIPWQ